MIQTSYFAKYKKDNGVSVARGIPVWFKGEKIEELFPSWVLIKDKSMTEVEWKNAYYYEVLSKLDVNQIVRKLEGKVMLCWEKPGEFCHRRVIAEWIERETGVRVPEVLFEEEPVQMGLFG